MRIDSTTGVDIQVRSNKSDDTPNRKDDTKLVSSFEVVLKKGMVCTARGKRGRIKRRNQSGCLYFISLFRDNSVNSASSPYVAGDENPMEPPKAGMNGRRQENQEFACDEMFGCTLQASALNVQLSNFNIERSVT